jgi:hypothetical protein
MASVLIATFIALAAKVAQPDARHLATGESASAEAGQARDVSFASQVNPLS